MQGGSGAGKTTLMDVVAGRKTQGVIRGDILVNGHPKDQATWSRVVGYVEQQDIHTPGLTVRESLLFSARLRLEESKFDLGAVRSQVDDTLQRVELGAIADRVVGEPGSGLSVEQFKVRAAAPSGEAAAAASTLRQLCLRSQGRPAACC